MENEEALIFIGKCYEQERSARARKNSCIEYYISKNRQELEKSFVESECEGLHEEGIVSRIERNFDARAFDYVMSML